MAKLDYSFGFDPTEMLKMYHKGIEDCFILISDFSELESLCGINNIQISHDNDDI